jgi:hypothetical protein
VKTLVAPSVEMSSIFVCLKSLLEVAVESVLPRTSAKLKEVFYRTFKTCLVHTSGLGFYGSILMQNLKSNIEFNLSADFLNLSALVAELSNNLELAAVRSKILAQLSSVSFYKLTRSLHIIR